MNLETCLDFFEFIFDRHLIWHKRFVLKEDPPWTNDPVLKNSQFCNVYRELDKGTIYLRKEIIENKTLDYPEKVFNIILYRFFNTYGFFQTHTEPVSPYEFNFKKLEKKFDLVRKNGHKLFTNAYLVNSKAHPKKYRTEDKHIQVLLSLKDLSGNTFTDFLEKLEWSQSPEKLFSEIEDNIRMVGPFLAYEIYCDLTYIKEFPWAENEFVNVGPGAHWGLNIMSGKKLTKKEVHELCCKLQEDQNIYWKDLLEYRDKDWTRIYYKKAQHPGPELSLRGIEHSLCEFRKYKNISNPDKRAKQRKFDVTKAKERSLLYRRYL